MYIMNDVGDLLACVVAYVVVCCPQSTRHGSPSAPGAECGRPREEEEVHPDPAIEYY